MSTRLAAVTGAAALSIVVSGVGYAATQPGTRIAVQEEESPSPVDPSVVPDPPTGLPEPPSDSPEPPDESPTPPDEPSDPGLPQDPVPAPTEGTGNGGAGGGTGGDAQQPNRPVTRVRQPTSNDDGLPITGTDVTSVVVLGGLLTAGGVGLVLTTTRRRRETG
jgi:LPXTG-motif cell wall-anchored protein